MDVLDILLKASSRRALKLAGAALVLAAFWGLCAQYPRQLYRAYFERGSNAPQTGGQAILEEIDRRQARKVEALHREVLAGLSRTRLNPREIKGLRAKADAALALNAKPFRRRAMQALMEVRREIPEMGKEGETR